MSVKANSTGIKNVRIKYRVVAVCDDQDGHVAANTPELDHFFTFDAIYMPPATALFRLSILVNKAPIYLQLIPNRIESLKKTTCDHRKKYPGTRFEAISKHLGGHRSFTRLQFQLFRDADLITPKDFNLDHHDAEAKCNFAAIISLATATNFSLYMPREVLRNADYQAFFRAFKRWSNSVEDQDPELARMADLRKMYNGNGGVLFGPDQYRPLTLVPEAAAVGSLSENIEGSGSSLPASQQSTASESDATTTTVAVATPPGYKADDGDGLPPPPYAEAHTHTSLKRKSENRRKHGLGSGDGNVGPHTLFKRRRSQVSDADAVSHSQFPFTDLIYKTFEVQIRKQEEEIQQLKADMAVLQSRNDALEKRCSDMERQNEALVEQYSDMEGRQGSMEKALESVYANINDEVEQGCLLVKDELRQESENLVNDHLDLWTDENMEDMVAGHMEKYMEQCMNEYVEEKAAGFMAELKRKLCSILND